jgi:uncharacterized membrane protein (DUF106 family)
VFDLPVSILALMASAAITLAITVIYRFLANQNEMKVLKAAMKEKQARIKELQKTNPTEANKLLNEVMELSNKQMKINMKPMLMTLLVIGVAFPWFGKLFPGNIVQLPFAIPFIGSALTWFWWYVIVSIPLGIAFRKLLRVEL